MILPVYAFGQKVLKQKAEDIDESYPELKELIENMWETMYNASGVGLAAPQIGKSIRLFLVDTLQLEDDDDGKTEKKGIKRVFINAQMIEESGKLWSYEEGCLSIPHIRGDVERQDHIKIKYLDESFNEHIEEYEGVNARVIQHEYDHIDGELFVDKLKPLKKKMIKRKLENIKKGQVKTDYRMRFIKL